ncbi:MAG: isocitrate/isopropylmalate dehydrogenase family protein [Erysipelotrichaceae bacterium]|nr:isocitrate/isopropylmalate dehydrogenase family protein [Erysipelotrichaceae bacterium]
MKHLITLIPGDGIGPEISQAMMEVIKATELPITWEITPAGLSTLESEGSLIPQSVFDSIERNRIALKGPLATPIGKGHRSLNVLLRKKYDLYACVRPVRSIANISPKFPGVDLVIFRENTEDLYMGLEEIISEDEAHSIKVITRSASTRIAKAAYEYAVKENRKKVTIVTKANIMKASDGLFLESCRAVAALYPTIITDEILIDNMCLQLVVDPTRTDIILTENLYGDILSDLCAGLVGGLGFVPGANLGQDFALFESVHGTAPDIAGLGIANPTAMILTSAMMIRHLGYEKEASWIEEAIQTVYSDPNNYTKDLQGPLNTVEITSEIIKAYLALKGVS